MNENDPKRKSEPIGPKHSYRDTGAEPKTNPSERPSPQPKTEPQREQPGHTEGPMKPLPDYGDAEPGDPRRMTTSGGNAGGEAGGGASGGGSTPAGGGPSSTLSA
jgi:hypothetical protein